MSGHHHPDWLVVEGPPGSGTWEVARRDGAVVATIARTTDRAAAHLMAAAPRLLDECRVYLATLEFDAVDGHLPECTCAPGDPCPICRVRGAIALAAPALHLLPARDEGMSATAAISSCALVGALLSAIAWGFGL